MGKRMKQNDLCAACVCVCGGCTGSGILLMRFVDWMRALFNDAYIHARSRAQNDDLARL